MENLKKSAYEYSIGSKVSTKSKIIEVQNANDQDTKGSDKALRDSSLVANQTVSAEKTPADVAADLPKRSNDNALEGKLPRNLLRESSFGAVTV